MKNISIIFKSSYQDDLSNSYEQVIEGVLIKDDLITTLRFYLEADYYQIIIKEKEIVIYKRGHEQVDMLFKQDFFKMIYYVGEEVIIEGKMKLYHHKHNKIILDYYLSEDESITNRIELDYIEE